MGWGVRIQDQRYLIKQCLFRLCKRGCPGPTLITYGTSISLLMLQGEASVKVLTKLNQLAAAPSRGNRSLTFERF